MEKTLTKKFKKFKRVKEKPGFHLQERDLEIINLVYQYRFLNAPQISALIDSSLQITQRRLQKLFHHGLLDRPREQLHSRAIGEGAKPIIYALANKGANLLAEYLGIDRGRIDWLTKNYEVKQLHIAHTMMISNFRTILTLALREKEDSEIIFWQQGEANQLKDFVEVEEERIPVSPDAFFGIRDGEDLMYFFLEADQSTMTNSRFLKKMIGYWHYWRQGRQKERYKIDAFRVLTITRTEARKENLRRVSKRADEKQIGSGMFWFCSEERYNSKKPQTILKKIWQTPKDDNFHSILE